MPSVTITELNVRAHEHVRTVNDADRYGWLREDARRAQVSRLRAGLGAVALLARRPTASAGTPADRSVLAPGTSGPSPMRAA
jgi:hemoglobin